MCMVLKRFCSFDIDKYCENIAMKNLEDICRLHGRITMLNGNEKHVD